MKHLFSNYLKNIDSVPEILKANYFNSLDGLRAISIFMLVIAHMNFRWHNEFVAKLFGGGNIGVYVFFVISGFLITMLLVKEKVNAGTIALKKFYISRFLRIFPVAYLYLIVAFILGYLFRQDVSVIACLGATLYVRNFSFAGGGSWYVNHYWSLSVEEQFYFISPAIIKRNLKSYGILLLFLISIVPIYRPYINLVCVVLIFIIHNSIFIHPNVINHTISACLIAIFLLNNLFVSNSLMFKFLNNKIMIWVGMMSYSIYIWQEIFTVNEKYVAGSFALPWYPFPPNIILLIGVSIISYNFYEKPFNKLKKRFK